MYKRTHSFFVNRFHLWNIILFAILANRFVQEHLVAACNSFIYIFRNCETFILAVFTKSFNCLAAFLKSKKASTYQKAKQSNILFFKYKNIFYVNIDGKENVQLFLNEDKNCRYNPFEVSSLMLNQNFPASNRIYTCIPCVILSPASWTDMGQNGVSFVFICCFLVFSAEFLNFMVPSISILALVSEELSNVHVINTLIKPGLKNKYCYFKIWWVSLLYHFIELSWWAVWHSLHNTF